MALTPFDREFGSAQGRIQPTGVTPPEGDFVFVLGHDIPGVEHDLTVGDEISISQLADFGADTLVCRVTVRTRPPDRMPLESLAEPFALADGQTLLVSVDGGADQTVTFNTADFVAIGTARAYEVAAKIRATLTGADSRTRVPNTVSIVSDKRGQGSSVAISGGTAAGTLGFTGRAWRASMLIDSVERAARQIDPGNTRDLQFAANVANLAGDHTLEFKLELVSV